MFWNVALILADKNKTRKNKINKMKNKAIFEI